MAIFSSSEVWKTLLKKYCENKLTDKELLRKLRDYFYHSQFQIIEDTVRFDRDRQKKSGVEEVIFAEGKNLSQLKKIVYELIKTPQKSKPFNLLITRLQLSFFEKIRLDYQEKVNKEFPLIYHQEGRVAHSLRTKNFSSISKTGKRKKNLKSQSHHRLLYRAKVAVLTAGTSDIPVGEECRVVLSYWGINTEKYYDVGVAGLGRLLGVIDSIRKCKVVVVIAGMEAALAGVVAGMVTAPVVAVPTSMGYGAHFKGLSSLLGMMNSCSPGVVVVNIDNGFGAAAAVRKILSIHH